MIVLGWTLADDLLQCRLSGERRARTLAASHSLSVLSWLPDRTCRHSGEKATTKTKPECPICGTTSILGLSCAAAQRQRCQRHRRRSNHPSNRRPHDPHDDPCPNRIGSTTAHFPRKLWLRQVQTSPTSNVLTSCGTCWVNSTPIIEPATSNSSTIARNRSRRSAASDTGNAPPFYGVTKLPGSPVDPARPAPNRVNWLVGPQRDHTYGKEQAVSRSDAPTALNFVEARTTMQFRYQLRVQEWEEARRPRWVLSLSTSSAR
jgi:hypothetical protein